LKQAVSGQPLAFAGTQNNRQADRLGGAGDGRRGRLPLGNLRERKEDAIGRAAGSPRVAIVNQTLALRAFGKASPIGRRVSFGRPSAVSRAHSAWGQISIL
jgi:hypothetical protein